MQTPAPKGNTAPPPGTSTPQTRRASRRRRVLVGLVGIAAAVVVTLSMTRDWPPALDDASPAPDAAAPSASAIEPQAETTPAPVAAAPHAELPKAEHPKTVQKPKPVRNAAPSKSVAVSSVPAPPAKTAAAERARSVTVEREASAAPKTVATPEITGAGAVTITGCLETTVREDRFRLTDTEGAEAPKARGWRSGFLKKRPAPVELVQAPDKEALLKYVGHRVSATGVLTDRELKVHSFEPAGAACS